MNSEYPKICVDSSKSDTERVGRLLECYNQFNYLSWNIDSIIFIEHTLRSLNQYVTLIGYDSNGNVGEVDIDMTISCMKNTLERQDKSWYAYGCRGR